VGLLISAAPIQPQENEHHWLAPAIQAPGFGAVCLALARWFGLLASGGRAAEPTLAAPAPAVTTPASASAPTTDLFRELQTALGWPLRQKRNGPTYMDEMPFSVRTDPSHWAAARQLADTWATQAPDFAQFSRREPAAPPRAHPGALLQRHRSRGVGDLRAERAALAAMAGQLDDLPIAIGTKDPGRAWRMADTLRELNESIGEWLRTLRRTGWPCSAKSWLTPATLDHAALVARYGGEENLKSLVDQAREDAAIGRRKKTRCKSSRKTPPRRPARKRSKKAEMAINAYSRLHGSDPPSQRLQESVDLAAELGEPGRNGGRGSINHPIWSRWPARRRREKSSPRPMPCRSTFYQGPAGRTASWAQRLIATGKIVPRFMPWNLMNWSDGPIDTAAAGNLAGLYDTLKARFPTWRSGPAPKATLGPSLPPWPGWAGSGGARADEGNAGFAAGRQLGLRSRPGPSSRNWRGPSGRHAQVLRRLSHRRPWNTLSGLAPAAGRRRELIALAERQVAAPCPVPRAALEIAPGLGAGSGGRPDPALAILEPAVETGPVAATRN